MDNSFLTGGNEIGLAFGEALAPDGDGLAKPIAVEGRRGGRGRRLGLRNKRGHCDLRAAARSHVGHCWMPLLAVNPGPRKRAGAGASLRGGGQLVIVGVDPRTRVGGVLRVLLMTVPSALPFPAPRVVLAATFIPVVGLARGLGNFLRAW